MKSWLNIGSRWISIMMPACLLLLLLVCWEFAVYQTKIEKWLLPGPIDILKAFWQGKELYWQHSLQTLKATILGFSAAVLLGVVIATLLDYSYLLRKAVYPLLIISQTIPIIAIAPLFIIWFGFGILPKALVVALVCFFPIAVNLADGYRLVDRDMLRLMEVMGAGKKQIFWMVKLPAQQY